MWKQPYNVLDRDEPLGEREIDKHYDWPVQNPQLFEDDVLQRIDQITAELKQHSVDYYKLTRPFSSIKPYELNTQQALFFEKVQAFLQTSKEAQEKTPFLYLIQSRPGCGKTTLLRTVMQHFLSHKVRFRAAAFTGTAANSLAGQTLASLFGVKKHIGGLEQLMEDEEVEDRQREYFDGVQFLIIDEIYNVGAKYLNFIEHSLRRMLHSEKPYGGLSVIMAGDRNQILPVRDISLMKDPEQLSASRRYEACGISSFRMITNICWLTVNVRAQKDKEYASMLNRFVKRRLLEKDIELLEKRFEKNLNSYEHIPFATATTLLGKRLAVANENVYQLQRAGGPVIRLEATTEPKEYRIHASEVMDIPTFYAAINARVMLTRNLLIPYGLTNGSLGFIREIIFNAKDRAALKFDSPSSIVVEFDEGVGVSGSRSLILNKHRWIPIVPIREEAMSWEIKKPLWVNFFPLLNADSMTIHKSMSKTLKKAKVCLDEVETTPSLAYVALSRVGRRNDLMIIPPYPNLREYWADKSTDHYYKMLKEEKLRCKNLKIGVVGAKLPFSCFNCQKRVLLCDQVERGRQRRNKVILCNTTNSSDEDDEDDDEDDHSQAKEMNTDSQKRKKLDREVQTQLVDPSIPREDLSASAAAAIAPPRLPSPPPPPLPPSSSSSPVSDRISTDNEVDLDKLLDELVDDVPKK